MFDHLAGIIVEAARVHRDTLDGILLSLHGVHGPSFCEDGEGELLRRLREVVGPELPIAVTLDLHAMVTQAMVEQAQILVSYKTYPHVDMRVTGRHAARLLDATIWGEIRPLDPAAGPADAGRGQCRAHRCARDGGARRPGRRA